MPTQKTISSEAALALAIEAFDSSQLSLRIVADNGMIKIITREDIPQFIKQGYLPQKDEQGTYYLSRGLPGGSPLDELERKLNTKRADQRSIFITYQWAQQDIAKKLQVALESKGFLVIRDEDNLMHNTYLPGFMKMINDRNVDYVLPIISKSYLESKNCMYEVNQVLNRPHWEKRLLPYVATLPYIKNGVSYEADAKIYTGIESYIAHWQQELAKTNDLDNKDIIENILKNLKPFTQAIVTKINIAESLLISTNYQALFDMIKTIEDEDHGIKFKEIYELLQQAEISADLEDTDEAKTHYEAALTKVKSMKHVAGVRGIFHAVYSSYSAFLLRQDNMEDKQLGEQYQRIAQKFVPTTPVNSNASSSSSGSSSSTSAPLNHAFQNLVVSNSTNTTTTTTTAAQSPAPNINPVDVAKLLQLVAEGEQDPAEVMIKANPALLLARGDVTDLSKRTFTNITAFQYAVWALDWHMWTMILKYLPPVEQKAQAEQFKTGAWVRAHGVSADKFIQNLITALQQYIDNYSKWSGPQYEEHWVKQVGGAQLYLPAHVINEYCRPDRSFYPTPKFLEQTLPRTRNTDAGEWFVARYQCGKLGEKWAAGRGACEESPSAIYPYPCLPAVYPSVAPRITKKVSGRDEIPRDDCESASELLAVRTNQRTQLVASLKNVNASTLRK